MRMIRTGCLLIAAFVALAATLEAVDFNVTLNQVAGVDNKNSEDAQVDYQAVFLPRFSGLIGDDGEFVVSAGMTLGYEEEFTAVPELLNTEVSLRLGNVGIKAGRVFYTDPLAFIAGGLFDGAQLYSNSAMGTFSAGVWYTGLLYKKNANITMTGYDQAKYDSAVDYGDFYATYFAPSRIITTLGWEHPSIGEAVRLKSAVIAQTDLNDEDYKYHSQYLVLKAGVPFKGLLFELGGSVEFAQMQWIDDGDSAVALAGAFGIFYTLPTSFLSRVSFNGTIGGGHKDDSDSIYAFVPITTKTFGTILEAKIAGLTALDLNYTARVNNAIGASLSAAYFIRNDLGTYQGYPVAGAGDSDGYALGGELFARIIWSPFSDVQLNFGGGAFFPGMGNVWADGEPQWRIELTAILGVL